MTAAVRLRLDAVTAPVVARVARRERDRMVVAHPLPFLRLRGGVRDEEGRAARIEAVRLDVLGDTPNLIMEVVYEQEPFRAAPRDDDTIPGFVPEMPEGGLSKRRDETVSFETQRTARCEVVVSDPPPPPVPGRSRWERLWTLVVAWIHRAEAAVDRALATRAA